MKKKILIGILAAFSFQSCGDGQNARSLPKYEDDFIASQNNFDIGQTQTFSTVAMGENKTQEIAQKTYSQDDKGRSDRKSDIESTKGEWENIKSSVVDLNGRFMDLGAKADAYFNETQNKLNSLPNDSDKNKLYSKFNQQKEAYMQKFKSVKRDLDELDRLVEQARHYVTKIEIAQSMQAMSGIMGEFSNISTQISSIKSRLSSFSQDSKKLINEGIKS